MVDLGKIHHQLVGPQGGTLAHGGGLCRLAVGIGHAGHVLVLLSKAGELCQHTDQLFANELQALPHHDDIGVIAHIAAGGTQMDDAGCLGALLAVGVNVAHHIMAHQLLARNGDLVVDIVHMGFQLGHHFGVILVRPCSISARASATHRRRQVWNLLSSEKMYCISSEE